MAAELKCPIENVISSGTRSHSAGLGGPPPGTPAAAAAAKAPRAAGPETSPLDEVVLDAVRQAIKKLQPARMAFGTGLCYLNVNRDTINPKTRLAGSRPALPPFYLSSSAAPGGRPGASSRLDGSREFENHNM